MVPRWLLALTLEAVPACGLIDILVSASTVTQMKRKEEKRKENKRKGG
jgi:hypothetical protein